MKEMLENFNCTLTELSLNFLSQPPALSKIDKFSSDDSMSPRSRLLLQETDKKSSTDGSRLSVEETSIYEKIRPE